MNTDFHSAAKPQPNKATDFTDGTRMTRIDESTRIVKFTTELQSLPRKFTESHGEKDKNKIYINHR